MRSLIATALLLGSDAMLEETSLMQGLVARHEKLSTGGSRQSRKDSTAQLMETATKMMKNGVTPDVVTFIETTITELNQNVLGAIVDEHNRDQQLINDLLDRFDSAVAAMEACAASVAQQHEDRTEASIAHKMCRSDESLDCARSRRCEEELEELWRRVKLEETEMRRIHDAIHGEWCVGPAPDHPGLADPFHWTITEYSEGAETSESINDYPAIDLEPVVIEFRRFSVEYFGHYIVQKPIVEEAWENYNRKLLECAALEETWTLKVDDCDALQIAVHDAACMHASSNRQCASNFGHEYHMTLVAYNNAVETIQQLEYDRKREWETLKITTCLLETVYTHVIHSIDSGEPCPTTESHPEQTEQEIQYCHVVEESLTANLTIDYGSPPPPPALPPVVPPPCTAEYIWEEHGSFPFEVQASHSQAIEAEGLQAYFTVLSTYGWAGCAAPRACTPCESTDLIVDPAYTANDVCKEHHQHLRPGQLDIDTFKCLSGEQCIHADGRCNGIANCDDGSDETACETHWGVPAVLHNEECQDPFVSDLQFRCADNTCTHIAGKCNGVNNCADGSDERDCATTTHHLTLEATSGYTSSIETPEIGDAVFYDRQYTFESLGDFMGKTYIKASNEDKHTRHSHVQIKVRLTQPTTVYVVALRELPWLQAEGWATNELEGPVYRGVRQTRHTEWSGVLEEDEYGPGVVWEKTFPAGTVEMRGNEGGDGSFLIFVGNPGEDRMCCRALTAECLACAAGVTVGEYCTRNPDTQGCVAIQPVYDCALSAYWEHGNCGCAGNDFQAGWCGGIGSGQCPETVATDLCPTGNAFLVEFNGLGGQGAGRNWRSDGCDYIWHAQYACQEEHPPPTMGGLVGQWVDQTGNFYGGATIALGDQCTVQNPSRPEWQTAAYHCDMRAGMWNFIETRAAGGVHSHAMVLQDDGTIRVTKGNSHVWILHPFTEPIACPDSGMHERDRCWYMSETGGTCREACNARGLDFSWLVGGEESPLVPLMLGRNPNRRQFPWGRLECYVPRDDRYHTAKDSANANTGDSGAVEDWSYSVCQLACPCAVPGGNPPGRGGCWQTEHGLVCG